jgi:hypothetical protein
MKPLVRVLGLVVLIAVSACSKSSPATHASLPKSEQLGVFTGVDPRAPGKAFPVARVVAPVQVPSGTHVGTPVTSAFQARPNLSCQMQIAYPSVAKNVSLPPKVTSDDGFISWTWTPTARGTVTTRIVCSGGQVGQATIHVL